MTQDTTYGQRVRALRKAKGWTQEELADASGVAYRTVQDIEADKRARPQRGTVLALNRALEIEGDPDDTRASWPADVQVFLDIVGAFLSTMDPDQRHAAIREMTAHLVRRP